VAAREVQRTVTPVDGSVYVERPLATEAEVDAALSRAAAAQREWRAVPLAERMAVCARVVDAFVARRDEIAREISWQMGRPIAHAPGEVRGFEERARQLIALAPEALADLDPGPKPGFRRMIRREPLGVVLQIAPWNYPYLVVVNTLVPALLAGNALVLKHAPQTPLCAERLAEACAGAGLPEGVFQFLHMSHAVCARAIRDPRVAFVSFTGSVRGGREVQRTAWERFIGVGLELGGKDPAYVRADADLAHATPNVVDGAFFNAGQSCCAVERVYVHRDVFDAFVERAVELIGRYVLGNPLDPATTLGPLVRPEAAAAVRAQIAEAVARGARPLVSESRFPSSRAGTPYLAPQLLVDVDHSMRVMRDESFGPVVGIMPVRSDEEAIALMNDSDYGLTASIWTRDTDAALRIGSALDTGTVFMNRCDYLDPALAWVGVKDSGRGCTLSRGGFDALTRPKSFHLRTSL
jgi:acyl-CoA reductase-like NAD-dependent aldehyde dehydrogenase